MPAQTADTYVWGLTEAERLTVKTYNNQAYDWFLSNYHGQTWLGELARIVELGCSGQALDVGCGGGTYYMPIVRKGFDYTGIDISEELVRIAVEAYPYGRFERQNLYQLRFGDRRFHLVWAAAVLLHVPKHRLSQALAEIHRVGKGLAFMSLIEGGGEEIKVEMSPSGRSYERFFAYYQMDEMFYWLRESGFQILEAVRRFDEDRGWTWLNLITRPNTTV